MRKNGLQHLIWVVTLQQCPVVTFFLWRVARMVYRNSYFLYQLFLNVLLLLELHLFQVDKINKFTDFFLIYTERGIQSVHMKIEMANSMYGTLQKSFALVFLLIFLYTMILTNKTCEIYVNENLQMVICIRREPVAHLMLIKNLLKIGEYWIWFRSEIECLKKYNKEVIYL